ncbi:MAG: bifunctional riboflavin kinase/FAD synthetase [Candidatus Zixiibacteriota bacterium]|nr:MAG: bifunctional riboflavin kinase/FAD synthetase [candidate division Zixibacteria bacterium]
MSVTFVRGLADYQRTDDRPVTVTIGTFDGIHRGHQEILRAVQRESAESGCAAVLVTFDPHPRVVISPEEIPLLLTSIEEKEKFIPHFFEGTVLVLEFNEALMEMSAEAFVRDILVEKLGAKKIVVGYDHTFGKNRSGTITELTALGEKHGFQSQVVGPVMHQGKPISSSRIRRAMRDDDYENALEMLGHDYAIYGTVEKGIGLGRRLGYPTANVRYSLRKLLPREGVYSCRVLVGQECLPGMMFIGKNYFNPQNRISVEANIFNFDRDIYDEEILVFPTHYVRGNRKFASTDKLVEQLKIDKENVMKIIEKERKDVDKQRAKSSNCI